jgi:endonuclease/exonuclease/phosphatase (EEP) superfamily protein YafD
MLAILLVTSTAVLAVAAAVLLFGSQYWLLDLLTFFWPWAVLAAVAVLLLSLLSPGPWAKLVAVAGLLVCLYPIFALPPAPDTMPGEKIRLLTANVYIGNPDPRPFVAMLTRVQPDIVITEETSRRFAEAIRGSGLYAFESDFGLSEGDDKKVFSRYPIRDYIQLDNLPGKPVRRHAARMVVDTPGGPLVVYAVHPDTPRSLWQWQYRGRYFERLAHSLAAERPDTPIVVAGDWNLPAHSGIFRSFFSETGLRFARPGYWLPVTRFSTKLARYIYFGSTIDHVAVSSAVRVTGWSRGDDIGSNHLPVIVDLALPSSNAVAGL